MSLSLRWLRWRLRSYFGRPRPGLSFALSLGLALGLAHGLALGLCGTELCSGGTLSSLPEVGRGRELEGGIVRTLSRLPRRAEDG